MIKKIIIFLSITVFLGASALTVYDGIKNGFAGITPQRVFNTATEIVRPAPSEDGPSVEELQAQLDEQIALLQQAQTDLGAAQNQIETLEGEIAQLQANELVNAEAIAELQNQKQALEADVLSYQNQITTLNNDIAVLQTYITQLEAFVINDLYILGEYFGTFNAVTDAQSQVLETGLDVTFTLTKETNGTYTIDGQWTVGEQELPVYINFTPWYDLGWNTFEMVVFQYSHQLFTGQDDVRGSSGAQDPIDPFAQFVNSLDWTVSQAFTQTAFVELKNGMQIFLPYTINITMMEFEEPSQQNLLLLNFGTTFEIETQSVEQIDVEFHFNFWKYMTEGSLGSAHSFYNFQINDYLNNGTTDPMVYWDDSVQNSTMFLELLAPFVQQNFSPVYVYGNQTAKDNNTPVYSFELFNTQIYDYVLNTLLDMEAGILTYFEPISNTFNLYVENFNINILVVISLQ